MNSHLTEDFVACFEKLPREVKNQARRIYRVWKTNPSYPSLHFKQVHAREALYSVRIGRGWRALGLMQGDSITWFWIGSHADYGHLLSRL